MVYLQLHPHVSVAMLESRTPVFLDLRRDRYFSLNRAAASAFDLLRSNPAAQLDDDAAAPLLATGLFRTAAEANDVSMTTPPLAQCELPVVNAPALALIDVMEIWWLLGRARRAIRIEPLERLIAARRCRAAGSANLTSTDEIVGLANRFRSARQWVPIRPTCLQDSLALHEWLVRRGGSPTLVFGVKLNPFAAHCWIQFEQMVLNDTIETVGAFTPILRVECS